MENEQKQEGNEEDSSPMIKMGITNKNDNNKEDDKNGGAKSQQNTKRKLVSSEEGDDHEGNGGDPSPEILSLESEEPKEKKRAALSMAASTEESTSSTGTAVVLSNIIPKKLLAAGGDFGEGIGLVSVFAHRKGEREEMQDRHLIKNAFALPLQLQQHNKDIIRRCSLFALFDGHGGKAAADFSAAEFPSRLQGAFAKHCVTSGANNTEDPKTLMEKSMKKILVDAYKQVDDGFLDEARKQKPPLKDGTTACTILLINDVLYSAFVGDTKAVVGRWKGESGEWLAMPLTSEHHPQQFEERMRIQKAGGVVRDGRVMGVLEVSRSIGDGPFKSHGVICTPDVKKLTLTASDWFLLIACDGLWKVFAPKDAVEFVAGKCRAALQQKISASNEKSDGGNSYGSGGAGIDYEQWVRVADQLCAEAVLRGSGDNVSVVLVAFPENISLNSANTSAKQ